MQAEALSIGAVERDTGIARDTLRVWERRYGFPEPVRNQKGERVYPLDQLRKLQQIRRLMDQGHRPGKIVSLSDDDLRQLESTLESQQQVSAHVRELVVVLQETDGSGLDPCFDRLYKDQGMDSFIIDTIVPLLRHVGELWARGKLQIFEEHFLTIAISRFLQSKITTLQNYAGRPRVLLATLPGEEHSLGLLMVASMLSAHGISVTNLGTQVPMNQIIHATDRYEVDVVGLTFSAAYQYDHIRDNVTELRDSIDEGIDVWIGGEGSRRLRKLPAGVTKFTRLDKLPM